MTLTVEQKFRILAEVANEREAKYEAAYEGGAEGKPFDPEPGEMRYHVHGSGTYGRINPKVFRCEVCKWYAPLTHFMAKPECWKAKQRELKRLANKLGVSLFPYDARPHADNDLLRINNPTAAIVAKNSVHQRTSESDGSVSVQQPDI